MNLIEDPLLKACAPKINWRRAVRANAIGLLGVTLLLGQSPRDQLAEADRLADQGNWSKARPIYASAEAQFHRIGDRGGELHAKLGRLHGDVEAGSYRDTREEV